MDLIRAGRRQLICRTGVGCLSLRGQGRRDRYPVSRRRSASAYSVGTARSDTFIMQRLEGDGLSFPAPRGNILAGTVHQLDLKPIRGKRFGWTPDAWVARAPSSPASTTTWTSCQNLTGGRGQNRRCLVARDCSSANRRTGPGHVHQWLQSLPLSRLSRPDLQGGTADRRSPTGRGVGPRPCVRPWQPDRREVARRCVRVSVIAGPTRARRQIGMI